MKVIEIKVNGEVYPCCPTMGAMPRFHEQTGREVTDIDPTSFSDLCTYLWCCIKSASNKEHKKFDLSLMDFADNVSPDDMTDWVEALQQSISPDEAKELDKAEKKSLP